jgi:hypothetical protein
MDEFSATNNTEFEEHQQQQPVRKISNIGNQQLLKS